MQQMWSATAITLSLSSGIHLIRVAIAAANNKRERGVQPGFLL
jgi:hypothetical protein